MRMSEDSSNLARKESSVSMLTELRKELLAEIGNGENRVPNENEIKGWIFDTYSENYVLGDIYRSIFSSAYDLLVGPDQLPSLEHSLEKIFELEKRPLPVSSFLTTSLDGKDIGVLVRREELSVGGFVYEITLFQRPLSKRTAGRLEVRACKKNPEPFISILTNEGWYHTSRKDVQENSIEAFALKCLAECHSDRNKKISIKSITNAGNAGSKRKNIFFENLLKDAYSNKVKSTKVIVPLDQVQPKDIDFAISLSSNVVNETIEMINEFGYPCIDILLYECNGELVMDDDYPAYLAYRALQLDDVPAVVVGPFSHPSVKIKQIGGAELIPPIIASRKLDPSEYPSCSKRLLLEKKLELLRPKNKIVNEVENEFIRFCWMLSQKNIKERELHDFLKMNPLAVDSHAASLHSDIQIGNYKADLLLRYKQSDKRVLLVELERHSDRIFTKANRLRAKVTHASQQVEDWIAEIRSGSANVPDWLIGQSSFEGMIVIGKSRDLDSEQKWKLQNINANRLIKIITYDDLLERLRRFMKTLSEK